LGLPVDTAENIYNMAKAGVGVVQKELRPSTPASALPDLTTGTPGGSQFITDLMERAGINTGNARPDSALARMAYTGGIIGGGSMIPGASAKGTLAAATGGALSGELFGPQYVGLGAMTPAAISAGAISARNALAARTAPNVEMFRQAGTAPSVGQATDSTFLHGLENLAAKFPGGSGIMKNFIEAQQSQMGARARTGVSAEEAGRAIETGIRGEGGFLARTKAEWQNLDNQMAKKIPQDYTLPPMKTAQVLDELTTPTRGAEATTSGLISPKLIEIRNNLNADIKAGQGEIPFTALRDLRSRVGSMLDDALVSGAPQGELRKVYGALTKDIEAGAKGAGAGQEFERQNNYYRARMDRVETVLDRVLGKNRLPEDIFKTFMPTDPDQANKVRAVMRSLEPDQRQIVSEAVVNRLGRANPANQNDVGDIFSSEKFLSNWNRISPEAKAQLFPDTRMRQNMETLVKASDAMREGKGIYSNPSGTAGSFAAFAVYASPFLALGHLAGGNLGAAFGGLLSGMSAPATAYLGSRMLTSPKIVEWLATPIRPGTPQAAAHLARLGVIYNQSSPELKQELARYMQSTQGRTSKADMIPQ
jgi:hypothetical protein